MSNDELVASEDASLAKELGDLFNSARLLRQRFSPATVKDLLSYDNGRKPLDGVIRAYYAECRKEIAKAKSKEEREKTAIKLARLDEKFPVPDKEARGRTFIEAENEHHGHEGKDSVSQIRSHSIQEAANIMSVESLDVYRIKVLWDGRVYNMAAI